MWPWGYDGGPEATEQHQKLLASPLADWSLQVGDSGDMPFSPFMSPTQLRASGEGQDHSNLSSLHLSPSMFSPTPDHKLSHMSNQNASFDHIAARLDREMHTSTNDAKLRMPIYQDSLPRIAQHAPLVPRPSKVPLATAFGNGTNGWGFDNVHAEECTRKLSTGLYGSQAQSMAVGGRREQNSPALQAFCSPHAQSPPEPGPLSTPSEYATSAHCNCKKSRCLKLYCECFASLRYCVGCNCHDCSNTRGHEAARDEAIRATRERNSTAFANKMHSGRGHATGCHCKNSLCLKKYCECFQAGAHCGNNCKCLSCQNYGGSQALDQARMSSGDKRRKGLSPTNIAAIANLSNSNTPTELERTSSSGDSGEAEAPVAGLHNGTASAGTSGMRRSSRVQERSISASANQIAVSSNEDSRRAAGSRGAFPALLLDESPTKRARISLPFGSIGPTSHSAGFFVQALAPPTYPFFGTTHTPVTKQVALSCLDFLCNRDLYTMSLVSSFWARAAMDEALWMTSKPEESELYPHSDKSTGFVIEDFGGST